MLFTSLTMSRLLKDVLQDKGIDDVFFLVLGGCLKTDFYPPSIITRNFPIRSLKRKTHREFNNTHAEITDARNQKICKTSSSNFSW